MFIDARKFYCSGKDTCDGKMQHCVLMGRTSPKKSIKMLERIKFTMVLTTREKWCFCLSMIRENSFFMLKNYLLAKRNYEDTQLHSPCHALRCDHRRTQNLIGNEIGSQPLSGISAHGHVTGSLLEICTFPWHCVVHLSIFIVQQTLLQLPVETYFVQNSWILFGHHRNCISAGSKCVLICQKWSLCVTRHWLTRCAMDPGRLAECFIRWPVAESKAVLKLQLNIMHDGMTLMNIFPQQSVLWTGGHQPVRRSLWTGK